MFPGIRRGSVCFSVANVMHICYIPKYFALFFKKNAFFFEKIKNTNKKQRKTIKKSKERGRLLSLNPWKQRPLLYYIIRCNSADRRRAFLLGLLHRCRCAWCAFPGLQLGSYTSASGRNLRK